MATRKNSRTDRPTTKKASSMVPSRSIYLVNMKSLQHMAMTCVCSHNHRGIIADEKEKEHHTCVHVWVRAPVASLVVCRGIRWDHPLAECSHRSLLRDINKCVHSGLRVTFSNSLVTGKIVKRINIDCHLFRDSSISLAYENVPLAGRYLPFPLSQNSSMHLGRVTHLWMRDISCCCWL